MRRIYKLFLLLMLLPIAFAAYDDTQSTCENAGYTWFTGGLNYHATYSFTDDLVGNEPQSWTITEVGTGTISVDSLVDGHNKVTKMYDGDSYVIMQLNNFIPASSGTIEFYFRTDDATQTSLLLSLRDGGWTNALNLRYDGGNLEYDDDSVHTIMSINSNQWYHVMIKFDCSSDWHLWIDGVSKDGGSGYGYRGIPTEFDILRFDTYGVSGGEYYTQYIDALGLSWYNYSVGQNKAPACCGDDGELDYFSNNSKTCYSGGFDLDNKKIYCESNGYSWFNDTASFSQKTWVNPSNYIKTADIFAADLDSDGDIDLLGTSMLEGQLIWWKNNGTGGFSKQIIESGYTFSDEYSPVGVFASDLDGDGDLDVVFDYGDIWWWKNDGAGNFNNKYRIENSWGSTTDVFCADLDGDDDIDVVSTSENEDQVAWWANNGTGGFGSKQLLADYVYAGGRSIFVADLDGDGDNDVLAEKRQNKILWWENNGAGGFSSEKEVDSNWLESYGVFASDLDGDGINDVIATGFQDDELWWWKNDGSGNFGAKQVIESSFDGAYRVFAKDFDNDGDNDLLATAVIGDEVAWWENNGTGGFGSKRTLGTSFDYARDVFITDINGDGDMDAVAVAFRDGKVAWWDNNMIRGSNGPCCGDDGSSDDFSNTTLTCSNGIIEPDQIKNQCENLGYHWLTGTITGSGGPCCGDDGPSEIFYNDTQMCSYGGLIYDADNAYTQDWLGDNINYTSGRGVCELKGYDWFSNSVDFSVYESYSAGDSPAGVAVGDLDGDGDLDAVVTARSDKTLRVYHNNGTGGLTLDAAYTVDTSPKTIRLGDLDGDGDLDIVNTNYISQTFSVSKNNGDGTFAADVTYSAGDYCEGLLLGDVDGDGDLDVITLGMGTTPKFYVSLNNGAGSYSTVSNYALGSTACYRGVLSDLDGDGNLDVVNSNAGSNSFEVRLGYGNGSFGFSSSYSVDGYPIGIAVGDLDGDGDLDVATANANSDSFNISLNNGDGTFVVGEGGYAGNSPHSIALGDLDGDGDLDVVNTARFSTWVVISLNEGSGSFSYEEVYGVGGNHPEGVALGDFDGDGSLDILNVNTDTDNMRLHFSSGMLGSNGACCGDDGAFDDFQNSTTVCLNGAILSDGDVSEVACYGINASNTWFTGEVTGSNYRCCGDDESLDYFGNNTHCCSYGVYTAGSCAFSPAGCLSEHIDLNGDFEWSTWPSDDCGLVNCTDFAAIDEDVDYVWDGYCYSGALNTSCISGSLPPFNTSFTVTVTGNLTELGTELPVIGETITITAGGVDYTDVTDSYGSWEVIVSYWELNCATSNTVIAEFSKDDREYSVSEAFSAVK